MKIHTSRQTQNIKTEINVISGTNGIRPIFVSYTILKCKVIPPRILNFSFALSVSTN